MDKIREWLKGKKTYITGAAIIACGILRSYGVEIPYYVWAALAVMECGFIHAAVQNAKP